MGLVRAKEVLHILVNLTAIYQLNDGDVMSQEYCNAMVNDLFNGKKIYLIII
jgi:hypothetical protein